MTALLNKIPVPAWRQIQRKNFYYWEELADFLELSPDLRKEVLPHPRFVLNLPRRLAEKIKKNTTDDPLFLQFVPLKKELDSSPGFVSEPVQDSSFQKTKKLLQKYQGRALILTTSACAMHCRFCFRQNFPYETQTADFAQELQYLQQHTDLNEVILSGGDPLSLTDGQLAQLFAGIETIPHIKKIRFHTRFPIGIPERIDNSFLQILESSSKQIIFIIHCNHPQEIDIDVAASLKRLQKLGIPVLNQAVLLKGVNDNEKTLLDLSETLVQNGIIPYYLHQLDLVEGAAHFAVSDERAQELIQFLQENTSGFAVPRLVREVPGQPSKSPIPLPSCG